MHIMLLRVLQIKIVVISHVSVNIGDVDLVP